jgi:large subunit ribosomal protein L9
MKVILREDIEDVGNIGDVLEVARGFARNYLIPRNKAVEATSRSLKAIEHAKRVIGEKAKKEKTALADYGKKVGATAITITANVGKDDKMFGSVTTKDIAEALAAQGIEIDKRKIQLPHPIKELGSTKVSIKLHSQVMTEVTVTVVKAQAPETPAEVPAAAQG